MLVHRRVTPSIKFAGTHLNTWVERGAVRVKSLAQEHNTMSPARSRSGVERTSHEAPHLPLVQITQLFHYLTRLLSQCVIVRNLESLVVGLAEALAARRN